MGACSSVQNSAFPADYNVLVKTGDRKGAGTSSSVCIAFYNTNGTKSPETKHECHCLEQFKAGTSKSFPVHNLGDFGRIRKIEIGIEKGNEWYVERIEVENAKSKEKDIFPVHRWIKADKKMILKRHDSTIPQRDEDAEQRKEELEAKKRIYQFNKIEGMMPNTIECPANEEFSHQYATDLKKIKWSSIFETIRIGITTSAFRSIEDMENVYTEKFPRPVGIENWKKDISFGALRLNGLNPIVLRLCSKIPERFPVTDDMLHDILEEMTIKDAILKKSLYIVDYAILKDLPCTDKKKVIPAPIALFLVNSDGNLMPVAIQLFQDPAEGNPIFLPTDPEDTWLAAKMWFNVADASYHQSACHLGFTHLLIGAVCIATHRCLSPSHPIFRLMAPHFMYLLAINTKAVSKLLSRGGWVDQVLMIGRVGLMEIIRRVWSGWRLDVHGNLPKELEDRGVADPEVLPNYYYRDDAMLLWNAIKKYVSAVVAGHYENVEILQNDHELQDWAKTLSSNDTGCGMKGVPGDGNFKTFEDVVETVTSFIFICSVTHAAVNFPQYNIYGFPPQYPSYLHGKPPTDKTPLSKADLINMLPDKSMMLNSLVMYSILSNKGTNGLGDFEVEYQFDPVGSKALQTFQADLIEIGAAIDSCNTTRPVPYPYLHPKDVPNSISI